MGMSTGTVLLLPPRDILMQLPTPCGYPIPMQIPSIFLGSQFTDADGDENSDNEDLEDNGGSAGND